MEKATTLKITSLLVILLGVPLANMANVFMPYAHNLWFNNDLNYFNLFWISVMAIQFTGFLVAVFFVRINRFALNEFGYGLQRKQTAVLLGGVLLFYLAAQTSVELLMQKNGAASCYVPASFDKRVVYCLSLLNAGISEEFMFRAFALSMMKKLNIHVAIAIPVSAVSFSFIHGMSAVPNFLQYFVFGVIMAIVFVWKKNVLYCMALHILYNFFTIFYCFIN